MSSTAALTAVARPTPPTGRRYAALVALMVTSFLLVTAEFLPNGLLTEMAADLAVSVGQAGQTITVTAFVGLLAAPTVGMIFPRWDRRSLLVCTAVAAGVSNLAVALAPSLPLLLLSRVLLGAAISTFWAMSITVAAAIIGPDRVGRAVMFTSAGVSLATVAGVPLGVLLSQATDWRAVFGLVAAVSAAVALPLWLLLPRVAAAPSGGVSVLIETVRRRGVGVAFAGHILVVFGHFLAYAYVRVALERIPGADAGAIVVLLAIFGLGGLVGNVIIGSVIDRTFVLFGLVAPLAIAGAVTAMLAFPGSIIAVGIAVGVWGFFFASWLIIINAWVAHRMPDRLEAGGSLSVVGFQLGIVVAAGAGGVLVDTAGVEANDALAVALLVAGAVLFGLANRGHRAQPAPC